MSEYTKIDSYLENNLDKSLAELSRLVAQPSVGAQNLGLKECAPWSVKCSRHAASMSKS